MRTAWLACLVILAMAKEFTLHAKQEKAIFSTKRNVIMCSGIQGGKTTAGALWLRNRVSTITAPDVNFLVTAPTHKIFLQATEPKFLEMFRSFGKYVSGDQYLEMNRGRRIYLRSLHDPDSIEGLTNVEGIWADELGKCTSKAWVNIEGRSAVRECPIFGTTTPYALNWLWKDIYKPWKAGKREDVDFIQFASVDNPYFPKAEYERQKRLLDPRVFAMKYMGQFERMSGLVYPDIDDELNFEDKFQPTPRDYFMCAGVDFGWNNPFAVAVRALHRTQPRDYQIGEYYRSYLTTSDKASIMLKMQDKLGIEAFYCDSAEPATIADLQRAGVKAYPVKKDADSIKNGIITHNELIRSREHKLFRGECPHTEDEYATYHYPEDKGEEENLDEKPVAANNHLMDGNRYVSMMTKEFRRIRDEKSVPPNARAKSDLEKLLAGEEGSQEEDWYNDG